MGVRLVEAKPSNLPVLLVFVEAYFNYDNLRFSPEVSSAVAQLLESPELGAYFLVLVDDEAQGYVGLTYGFDAEAGGRIGVITDFYLRESARGKGVGRSALRQVIGFAKDKGLRQVDLFVIEGNQRAESLYRSEGFDRIKGRFVMSRSL